MELMKFFGRGFAGLGFVAAAILLAGCETDSTYKFDPLMQNTPPAQGGGSAMAAAPAADASQTTLLKGNVVGFSFSDTPVAIPAIEDTVKEDGSVTLIYNEKFQAEGKTIGALQEEIRERYVPKYFKYLTVTVRSSQDRFYFVGGEVRSPNRQIYSGRMTVLGAIDTAGGFTDYANKSKVQVTRANNETFYVNCKKALTHPELNREIFPGDKIQVPKRWF